ncbi:MAG TPA: galactokinase [Micromonosporaceae bacterium]|nr:galactokinase [Micromonosporaceae bacterium]
MRAEARASGIEGQATAGARAAAAFEREYGGPYGVWDAPGRVNLIGEHTDYNDGYVLPFALPLRTAVAAAARELPMWTVWSEQAGEAVRFGEAELEPGRVTGWAAYVAGVVWALREAGHAVPGAAMAIASDVPLGAGLSSSAALESAVLTALADLGGLRLEVHERPALGQRAENAYVGVPCGIMDQTASLRCRSGHALFLDCRTLAVEQIPFDPPGAGLSVLLLDSRAPHRHAGGEYAARRSACESAAATLGVAALRDVTVAELDAALARLSSDEQRRRVRHVVTENQRVLDTVARLRSGDLRAAGHLLTASHASMRDDFEITVPEVDVAVEAAISAGAYGARMTGGGFGGCVLALVESAGEIEVRAAIESAYAAHGFTAPTFYPAEASDAARRLKSME